ncbi:hypothetical protein JSQ81_04555 [Sporosarcina sp. Marseille-Q4063]|uniref:hypothetical protein n=1 Tax=Sporosarcina sp. Marseille-Q4063 TaxID=2810514 RepID=UPI001BAED3FC|nr:hypothetical protein [Sporosarcina sp. Marseille-Q4063]QUW22856.1 hypothetical protein JSQ81_04555 [Sporosarcina sp. Marseille-Q4063]
MGRVYETRHVFMAIAIVILLISPILLLIIPSAVADTLYYSPNNWGVIVPGEGYVAYIIAFIFLLLASAILFFLDLKKNSIILSIIFVLASVVSFYLASSTYTVLSNESISYRTLFSKEKHTYNWDEIEKAFYYDRIPGDGFPKFEFIFIDGNSMKLTETGHVKELSGGIRSMANVEYIGVD